MHCSLEKGSLPPTSAPSPSTVKEMHGLSSSENKQTNKPPHQPKTKKQTKTPNPNSPLPKDSDGPEIPRSVNFPCRQAEFSVDPLVKRRATVEPRVSALQKARAESKESPKPHPRSLWLPLHAEKMLPHPSTTRQDFSSSVWPEICKPFSPLSLSVFLPLGAYFLFEISSFGCMTCGKVSWKSLSPRVWKRASWHK